MLVYYLFYKFTSFSLKFGTPGDEGFIDKDAISLLWWIVATWFKDFLNCHTLCSYLYRAGEFTNYVSCFLGRVVFAYPLWPGDVFTEFCCACWWHFNSTRLSVCRYACYLKTISSGALFRFIDSWMMIT